MAIHFWRLYCRNMTATHHTGELKITSQATWRDSEAGGLFPALFPAQTFKMSPDTFHIVAYLCSRTHESAVHSLSSAYQRLSLC